MPKLCASKAWHKSQYRIKNPSRGSCIGRMGKLIRSGRKSRAPVAGFLFATERDHMNKKIIVKIVGIAVGVLTCLFLISFFISGGNKVIASKTPTITITEPQNNFSIQATSTTLKGKVEPSNVALLIQGNRIKPNTDGSFSYDVHLVNEGANRIVVIATNGSKQASSDITINRIFTETEKAAKAQADAKAQAKAQAEQTAKDLQAKAIMTKVSKKYDEIQKAAYYYANAFPADYFNSAVMLYAVKPDNDSPTLYLKVQYHGDDWLFIQNYIFNVDGTNYQLKPNKVEKDNSDTVWEWSVSPVNAEVMDIVKAVVNGKVVKIRYVGQQYYQDRTLTSTEKAAMQDVLNVYDLLRVNQ